MSVSVTSHPCSVRWEGVLHSVGINIRIKYIIVLTCFRIVLQEETNRMSANALAIVFAPCVLRCPDTTDPLQSVQDISKTTAYVCQPFTARCSSADSVMLNYINVHIGLNLHPCNVKIAVMLYHICKFGEDHKPCRYQNILCMYVALCWCLQQFV